MKTLVKIFAFFVIVIAGTCLFTQRATAQNDNVSLQVFYDELSPYGSWIEDANYGYVWIPRVDNDFCPYVSNGHWALTDFGWTWASDYPWGWAPFHYGRWYEDPIYGYMWIPDTEWGPAWVTWRQANGYIGWTPMGPGININIALSRSYDVPRDRWVFVRDRDFMQNNLYSYRLDRSLNFRIFDMSLVIRNTRYDNRRNSTYVFGPRREDVQRFSGRIINPLHIRDYDRPGQHFDRDYLSIYRPQIHQNSYNGRTPAPKFINKSMDVRDMSDKNRENIGNNRNNSNQERNTQPNTSTYRNQREMQPSRNETPSNSVRNAQPTQQTRVTPSVNQRESQPSRNGNSYNSERNAPSVQPTVVKPQTNQRSERPAQNVRSSENTRPQEVKSVATPANNQRGSSPQAERSIVNIRQEKVRMENNSEKDKKGESKNNQPRR